LKAAREWDVDLASSVMYEDPENDRKPADTADVGMFVWEAALNIKAATLGQHVKRKDRAMSNQTTLIPKVIHYCWFGRGEMNDTIKKCIASWEKNCPDYQIVRWDEDDFDVTQNAYVREAYEQKKWAFVSDYVRLYALYNHGGIYLDTDVEILKPLDDLLNLGSVVTGYQDGYSIPAGIIMAVSQNEWIGKLLSYYDNRHFLREDGTLDMTTNSDIITAQSVNECGFHIGDSYIALGDVHLLESVFFAPPFKIKKISDRSADCFLIDPEKTYTVHYGTGTWIHRGLMFRCRFFVVRLARIILTDSLYVKLKTKIKKRKMGI